MDCKDAGGMMAMVVVMRRRRMIMTVGKALKTIRLCRPFTHRQ
jgi:hypothetical protein